MIVYDRNYDLISGKICNSIVRSITVLIENIFFYLKGGLTVIRTDYNT